MILNSKLSHRFRSKPELYVHFQLDAELKLVLAKKKPMTAAWVHRYFDEVEIVTACRLRMSSFVWKFYLVPQVFRMKVATTQCHVSRLWVCTGCSNLPSARSALDWSKRQQRYTNPICAANMNNNSNICFRISGRLRYGEPVEAMQRECMSERRQRGKTKRVNVEVIHL